MYSSPNSSNTIPFINGNNHDHQISPYPSSSNNNVIRPFSIESNPSSSSSSKQEQANNNNNNNCPSSPSFSFFQFPYSSLFEDNEIFLNGEFHYLHHHQHHHQSLTGPGRDDQAGAANMQVVSVSNAIKNNNNNTQGMTVSATVAATTTAPAAATTTAAAPTRRRTSKRDRHSKINTARGLRDRRMRLSLEVARRFFGLQDMLGFDKASKTVEWLLNQAKVEIKQLAREKKNQNHQSCSSEFNNGGKSASSTSECEGVSSLDEVAISQSQLREEKMLSPPPTRKRRGSNKGSRKSAFNQIGKESREKARERARERTREKTRLKKLVHQESSKGNNNNHKQCNKNNDDDAATSVVGLNRLSSWNPFENVEESAAAAVAGTNNTNHNHNHSSNRHQNQGLNEISSSCDYEEESLVTMSKWSPTMIFNNPLINTSPILQEHHQFAEFHHQTMGKPWEAYNNEV